MPRKKRVISPNATGFSLNNNPQAVLKREVSHELQRDPLENTLIYGEHDALPLKIARLVNKSPATKACIDTKAKYIKGSGFSNPDLMKLKVDKNGTTLWQFHTMLSDMLALFEGFSVNFKFNRMGKITNTYPLNFESVRLSKPDDEGYIATVKYNPYFGTELYKQEQTCSYPVFDIQQVLNQIAKEDKKFKGQVYYYGRTSPVYRFYPVPSYWSAEYWINVDANIQVFHSNNLDKGFFQTLVFNAIGDPNEPSKNPKYQKTVIGDDGVKRNESTKTVGEEFGIGISDGFAGAEKAGGGITFWSQNQDTAVKMTAVPTNQNHDLFTTLQNLCDEKITQATLVPGILANIQRGVNLGSGGSEIQKAVELMQSRTVEERQLLEDFYNEIMLPNLDVPPTEKVEILNFTPITTPVEIDDKFWDVMDEEEKRDFIKTNVPGVKLKEVINVTTTTQETTQTEPQQVNDNLKNLTGRQLQGIQRIVRKFNKGEITMEQAKQLLKNGFGFTDTDVNDWLITTEEELQDG